PAVAVPPAVAGPSALPEQAPPSAQGPSGPPAQTPPQPPSLHTPASSPNLRERFAPSPPSPSVQLTAVDWEQALWGLAGLLLMPVIGVVLGYRQARGAGRREAVNPSVAPC